MSLVLRSTAAQTGENRGQGSGPQIALSTPASHCILQYNSSHHQYARP